MPFSTVELQQRAAIPNDLAALDGRRYVTASETNDGTRLNESRIKALTGCDPITARFLHGEFFTFRPQAKFWLAVNHKPIVRDDSYGFWRRIRLIPFTETFPVTPGLAVALRAEFPRPSNTTPRAGWRRATATARPAPHRFYSFNITLHIAPFLGPRPITAVTRADCRDLITACRQKGLKRASLLGVQRTLSAVLSHAMEDGLLPANPAFRMGKHLRLGDEQRPEIQPLTHWEVHQFLEAVRDKMPEYHPFFLCALRTGMRLGELLALQWGDVDVTGRFLEVRRNLVAGHLTSTKNTNRRRVDMSLKLTETLRELHRERKAAYLKAGKPVPAWVFINSDGTALDGDNVRHRVFYRLLESAKLREIRFHDLRHTFTSLLIQNGAPLTYVKEQMGQQLDSGDGGRVRASRAECESGRSGSVGRDPNPQPRPNRTGAARSAV
jgi:integrase